MEKKYSRRQFIKNTSIASVGLSLGLSALTSKSYSRILGANDRVNFGVIGLHGRGREHIHSISACENAMVTHICDVDQRELERANLLIKEKFETEPVKQKDIRKLLESKEIDAITIA
ncbi:Gfo/Idh/MocA family oxidoreductase, partial [candidate division KSB1 bacterium]|nr:Gfo/Idh/MocA family oxidoreductase [candidate division KSB1 bacterium]